MIQTSILGLDSILIVQVINYQLTKLNAPNRNKVMKHTNISHQLLSTFGLDSLGSRGTLHTFFHLLFEFVLDSETSVFPSLGGVPCSLLNCLGDHPGAPFVFEIFFVHLVGFECVQNLSGTIRTSPSLESTHGSFPVNKLFLALDILNIFPIVLDLSLGFAQDLFQEGDLNGADHISKVV